MGRKSVHVTYRKNEGQWCVTNGSNGQAVGKYQTQKEAMQKGGIRIIIRTPPFLLSTCF